MMRQRRWVPIAVAAVLASLVAFPATAQEATLAACPQGAAPAGFDDVAATNVHADSIDCAVARDLLRGKTDTTYEPASSTTRGQTASLLARTLDEAGLELPPADVPPFDDAVGTTHADNIARLAAAGIISGRADGSFGPGVPVNRAQMASLVVRAFEYALGLPQPAMTAAGFTDVPATSTHAANIDAAVELGLLIGRSDTSFDPASDTRRDQMASIGVRLLGEVEALPEADFTLTVLHANDGESMLLPDADAGFPGVARFVADMLSLQSAAIAGDDAGVVTVSSGDNFLAGPRLNASRLVDGAPFYDALVYNEANFDAMTIGNHEFDFTPDLLADFILAVDDDIPFLSANIDVSNEPVLQALGDRIVPSTVIETAGQRVGIIGAVYEELESVSSPRDVIINEVLPAVQAEVATLQADDVDLILLSSHLQDLSTELSLIPELSGVDAVIGGGGGEALRDDFPLFAVDADGKQVPVVTTPGNYTDIGRLVLGFDDAGDLVRIDSLASSLLPVAMSGPRNPTMLTDVEAPVAAYVESLAVNVLATTAVPLDGRRDFVRTRETNLGTMLADAMLFAARDRAAGVGAPEPDIALTNGGGIRNDSVIGPGDVTELDTFNVAAFLNFVSVAEIDGTTLLAVMEHALESVPDPAGGFGQWSGVEFEYDPTEPVGDRLVDVTVTRADGTTEVELVVDGVATPAVSEDFAIASVNFLLDGGDDFPFPDDLAYNQLPVTYQEALAELIADLGTITATDYPDLTVDEDRYRRFGPVGGTFIN